MILIFNRKERILFLAAVSKTLRDQWLSFIKKYILSLPIVRLSEEVGLTSSPNKTEDGFVYINGQQVHIIAIIYLLCFTLVIKLPTKEEEEDIKETPQELFDSDQVVLGEKHGEGRFTFI